MPKAISILFGALFTIATAYSLGCIFLQRSRMKFARKLFVEEHHLFGFISGAALLSAVLFALAAVHLIYDATLWIVGLASILAAWRLRAFRVKADHLPALPRPWQIFFWTGYAVFAVVAVIHAVAPERSPDGSSYHLGFVSSYYHAHGFIKITTNLYACLSQGLELLFLNAWAFGRHSSAALVHCAFLLALPLLVLRFGQRSGAPKAGAAAALFTFFSPIVILDGASAYNDLAVACVLFAVFYLCEIDAPPLLTGLLAGFCYAMKYTAFLALVYVVLRYAFKRRWRDIAVACAVASVLIIPWIVRNSIWYGNPFAPLLNAWFPNPYVHVSFEQDYVEQMRRYIGLEDYRQIPLELTVRGGILGGLLGPLFLLTPLALLSLRTALGRRVLAAGALFALPYASNIGTRFLIPCLPYFSFALAAALPSLVLPALILAHGVLSFPDVPARYADEHGWRIREIPWRQALRIESEPSWLSRDWPPYRIVRMVENATSADAVVYSFFGIAESYTSRNTMVSFQSAFGERLLDILYIPLIDDRPPRWQIEFTFPRQDLTALRLVQTGAPKPGVPQVRDVWSIGEFRIFDQNRELPRAADWLLSSSSAPWDLQDAFDNRPITRWRSWQRIKPGMFVQVAFPKPQSADCVRLEASPDQWGVALKLEGRDASGQWKELSRDPQACGRPVPLELRRLAIEELKRAGITHLLISEDNFEWQDFRDKAALWGISEAGAVDNVRLYKLQ